MKYFRYVFIVGYVFILFLIVYFAASSASESTKTSDKTTEIVIEVYDAITPTKESVKNRYSMDEISHFVRKAIGHFLLFSALGFFASMTYIYFINKMKLRLILSLISGIIVAIISEIIQIFAEGRGPAIKDVLLDYSGYLLSTLIILLIMFLIIKKKRGKINDS